jgi:hypothetical protein
MASLFQGDPQKATSYTTSSSETPKWMQDAIYNQIQVAQNIANTPFQNYNFPRVATQTDATKQAQKNVVGNQGFFQADLDKAQSGMYGFASKGTADQLGAAQGQYLYDPTKTSSMISSGTGYFDKAGATTADALSERALKAADPYLQAAGQSAASTVGQYMSPYQTGVLDVIARQGARNLSENILPGVSDSFIKAGQFGSSRMGEFGSRAVRDTQEAVLDRQAQLANQGYGQAMSAAQADLARQGQLAGTVGSISGADLSRILQGGAQYGSIGQAYTGAGQAQQQLGLSAAQAEQQARAADYQRQMSALNQYAQMQQLEQTMRNTDVASLSAVGQDQQAQKQRELDMAYQQNQEELLYPKQQMDWLSTQIRGMAPITPQTMTQSGTTTGATYSPSILSQIASGYGAYKGLSSLG